MARPGLTRASTQMKKKLATKTLRFYTLANLDNATLQEV
jgi:hypothetical protein